MFTHLRSACVSRAREGCSKCCARFRSGAVAMLAMSCSAHAHGIAGNRFFPGTLTFDDPAVNDELILPHVSSSKNPGEGGDVVDNKFNWAFSRLLVPKIAVGVDSGWIHRNWGNSHRSGFDATNLMIKGEVFRDNLHETLVSAGLAWGIGHSGAQGVGPMHPIPSRRVSSSARASATFPIVSRGCDRLPLPGQLRSNIRRPVPR